MFQTKNTSLFKPIFVENKSKKQAKQNTCFNANKRINNKIKNKWFQKQKTDKSQKTIGSNNKHIIRSN